MYAPTNAAKKAKTNAKYPTKDGGAGVIPVAAADVDNGLTMFPITGSNVGFAQIIDKNFWSLGEISSTGPDDFISPFVPQFMKTDGDGAPVRV